jgi:hypothetical protein
VIQALYLDSDFIIEIIFGKIVCNALSQFKRNYSIYKKATSVYVIILSQIDQVNSGTLYCYCVLNVITLSWPQSDHIKWLPLSKFHCVLS